MYLSLQVRLSYIKSCCCETIRRTGSFFMKFAHSGMIPIQDQSIIHQVSSFYYWPIKASALHIFSTYSLLTSIYPLYRHVGPHLTLAKSLRHEAASSADYDCVRIGWSMFQQADETRLKQHESNIRLFYISGATNSFSYI